MNPSARSLRPLRLGLFGCALDTGNLGVSALALSTISGLCRTGRQIELTLFDRGGPRRTRSLSGSGWCIEIAQIGGFLSRRYLSPRNLQAAHLLARLGLGRRHPLAALVSELDGVLEISGGDSFSDLYGERRFRGQTLSKRLALELGVPLVLLPQTFGPFRTSRRRSIASRIVRGARQSWARDRAGLELLLELSGTGERSHLGLDVAFGLESIAPDDPALRESIVSLRAESELLLGLNPSGLLYADPDGASRQFGLVGSYRETLERVLDMLLGVRGARVVLIPHVRHAAESDVRACEALLAALPPHHADRVSLLPFLEDPRAAKWVIGQLDWLCATRMHAAIAGLSQGIPVTTLAYSDKAQGVLDRVGAAGGLVDLRKDDPRSVVDRVGDGFAQRAALASELRAGLAAVEGALAQMYDSILAGLERGSR